MGWVTYGVTGRGVARGYHRLIEGLRAALQQAGVELEEAAFRPMSSATLLHVTPPHVFQPFPGKVNVLLTMWEGDRLPDQMARNVARADVCLVPSRYCQGVWRASGLSSAVVPLGLTTDYVECDPSRALLMPRRLRFLSVASKLDRKGWDMLAAAFRVAFSDGTDVELYAKAIGDGSTQDYYGGRVLIDQRDLSDEDMLRLYQSADVFVTASRGEGFGLPALEAMATGCLVVAPKVGGLADFVARETAVVVPRSQPITITYGVPFRTMMPGPHDLAAGMRVAYELWGTPALEARRKAGTRVARVFTWARAAELLARLLSEAEARHWARAS